MRYLPAYRVLKFFVFLYPKYMCLQPLPKMLQK